MNILKRARFVFRGSKGLEKLVYLERHIVGLLDTCLGRIACKYIEAVFTFADTEKEN